MSLYSSSVPKQISSHDRGWSSTMVIAGSLGNRKRSPFGASPVMLLASPWRMPGQMKTASRWSLSTKWVEWCCFRGSRIWWPPRQSDRNVLFVEGIHVYVHMYTYIYSYINIYIYIYTTCIYIYIWSHVSNWGSLRASVFDDYMWYNHTFLSELSSKPFGSRSRSNAQLIWMSEPPKDQNCATVGPTSYIFVAGILAFIGMKE